MAEAISLGISAVSGLATVWTIHRNLKYLNDIPKEIGSLSNECSQLEIILRGINTIAQEPQHQGSASSSRLARSATAPIVDTALADAHTRLSDLQSFIIYISKKAREDHKGDHWQWIRKRNNIDRLRAELRSIRYDLALRCGNAIPGSSIHKLVVEQHTGQKMIDSTPRQGGEFDYRAKANDLRASSEIWSQLCQEYQQAEWTSAYTQWPQVKAIQAPNSPESETCPTVQESSSSRPRLLLSCRAITLLLGRLRSSIRTCYILVALVMLSIAGSLALALWRTINNSDIQGGFSIAQYILAVGALVVGCVLVLHSRTCSCWSSPSSTGGNGTPPESCPIELQQTGGSDSPVLPTTRLLV